VKAPEVDAFLADHPQMSSFKIEGEGHFRILRNPVVIRQIILFLEEKKYLVV
jgi:hypothetical protein